MNDLTQTVIITVVFKITESSVLGFYSETKKVLNGYLFQEPIRNRKFSKSGLKRICLSLTRGKYRLES